VKFLLLGILIVRASARDASAQSSDAGRPAAEVLRARLEQMQTAKPEAGRGQLAARKALPLIYKEAGYQPFWTSDRLETLLAIVRESAQDGLRPEDYHLADLEKLAPVLKTSSPDPVSRANVDLLATDAFYLLLYHLYLGKVDPKSLDANWNFEPRPIGDRTGVAFVLGALKQGQLREAVAKVRPDHWWYTKARAALAEYRGLASRGGWPAIPPGPTLKRGMKDARVVALRRRLATTGELSGQPLDAPVFDEPVAAALKKFQARHRLPPDGAVGPGTLAELNVPVEARVLQIRLNLERARWVLHEITDGDLVIVDIAGFEVAFVRKGQVAWRAKVQIGKPFRQTPIFKSAIDTVVFNPTWTVPPGILANDILPAARRDPGYFQRKGLDVLDRNGKKVDPASINWKAQKAGTFPYTVQQGPGPDNALGLVKILFPNPYFVYLHDTSHRELFEKHERAFSSGCMRVERPLELAALVLNDPKGWNAASIGEVIQTGKTRTVRLKQAVPVLIMYWTIDPAGPGATVFKRDPYKRDPPLARALDVALSSGPSVSAR
jgi:L,D-transpeptidase YcbB